MADYIPFAIQSEIIKRLPTKSLMQFRSVSKSWKSLIDSSNFIADYSFNHIQQQHLLVSYLASDTCEQNYVSFVDNNTFPQQKFSLPVPIPELNMLTIIGSSQGLFCLYSIRDDPNEPERISKTAVLWNPSIRKSVAIVVPDMIEPNSYLDIGFGVCPHTRDPKLVKIKFSHCLSNMDTIISPPWQVEVYSLSSRAWRSIPSINRLRQSLTLIWEQVVIDGFIYWVAMDGISTILIVSFDITNEKFMEVSLPNTLASAHNVGISKLKDSLVVVVEEAGKQVYGVWMMELGVPNTFTKLFTINSPEASPPGVREFRKNDEPVFEMRSTDSNTNDLVVNEVISEHINYIGISVKGIYFSATSYMETLLLLDY